MIKAIRALFKGPPVLSDREKLIEQINEARRRMNLARAHYDTVLESVIWTEDRDTRVGLAWREYKAAEERYDYLLSLAKKDGVRAEWEDVVV